MPATIDELIDKVDRSEEIRDQIAAILVVESARQQALATEANKNPKLWKLRVFVDTANPLAEYEAAENQNNLAPAVNVWFDESSVDAKASSVVDKQKYAGTFNVDCYGCGIGSDVTGGGHIAGDKLAASEAQRAARLVRNILMSGHYTYLGFERGVIARRMVTSVKVFQPQIDNRQVHHVVGVRLTLGVDYVETAPQVQGQPLEVIHVECKRAATGEILFEAQYGEETDDS